MGFKSHILKKKKTGSRPGSSGFPVNPPGRPGVAGLLPQPVFY
jgi:hypothetical protein